MAWGGAEIALSASLGFVAFKIFPIKEFFLLPEIGLSLSGVVTGLMVFGALTILISSLLTTSYLLLRKFSVEKESPKKESLDPKLSPKKISTYVGEFFRVGAAIINAAGPVASIFLLMPAAPTVGLLIGGACLAVVLFIARVYDYYYVNGPFVTKNIEKWSNDFSNALTTFLEKFQTKETKTSSFGSREPLKHSGLVPLLQPQGQPTQGNDKIRKHIPAFSTFKCAGHERTVFTGR